LVLLFRYFPDEGSNGVISNGRQDIIVYDCEPETSPVSYHADADCDLPYNPSRSPFPAAASMQLDHHDAGDGTVNGQ